MLRGKLKMTNSNENQKYQLTEKDFKQVNRKSLFLFQSGWNYERMQNTGYLYLILPQLRKIYGDNTPELKQAMKTHVQFFNTSNFFNTIITGIDLALEEKEGAKSLDAVAGIKAGLLGPFAANMAINGNPTGVFIWVLANIFIMIFRWKQLKFAYKEGVNLVTTMQNQMSALTDAATMLGVFMVGALVATMINVHIGWQPMIGKVPLDIQNTLDMLMPKILPAGIVGVIYWMLGKKNMTSTRAIFIVLIVSVALSALGVIAK